MNNDETNSDLLIDMLTDKNKWAAVVLIQIIKSVLIGIVFSVVTSLMFQGLYLWIGIGVILAIVLSLRAIVNMNQLKNGYDEFSSLFENAPESARLKLLKTVLESQSFSDRENKPATLLTPEASGKIIEALIADGILDHDDDAPCSSDHPFEIARHLREHIRTPLCSFDCECIEDDNDYKHLMNELLSITQGKLQVTGIKSMLNDETETAEIEFVFNGKKTVWSFKQETDWVSDEFFRKLSKLASSHTDSEFLFFPAEDQCADIVFIPKPSAKLLVTYGVLSNY